MKRLASFIASGAALSLAFGLGVVACSQAEVGDIPGTSDAKPALKKNVKDDKDEDGALGTDGEESIEKGDDEDDGDGTAADGDAPGPTAPAPGPAPATDGTDGTDGSATTTPTTPAPAPAPAPNPAPACTPQTVKTRDFATFAATMPYDLSVSNPGFGGLPAQLTMLESELAGGQALFITNTSGKLFYRIHAPDYLAVDCPAGMLMHAVDNVYPVGKVLGSKPFVEMLTTGWPIPAGTKYLYAGYVDTAYTDNEPLRATPTSTQGCHYRIEVRTVCPP